MGLRKGQIYPCTNYIPIKDFMSNLTVEKLIRNRPGEGAFT
jgi:hypothetical protein